LWNFLLLVDPVEPEPVEPVEVVVLAATLAVGADVALPDPALLAAVTVTSTVEPTSALPSP